MSREIAPSFDTLQTNDPSLDTVIPSLDGSTTAPPVSAQPEAVWRELPDGTTKATMKIGTSIYSAVFSKNHSYTARTRYSEVEGGDATIQVFLSTRGPSPLSAEFTEFADGKTSIVTFHVNDQHLEPVYARTTHGDLEAGAIAFVKEYFDAIYVEGKPQTYMGDFLRFQISFYASEIGSIFVQDITWRPRRQSDLERAVMKEITDAGFAKTIPLHTAEAQRHLARAICRPKYISQKWLVLEGRELSSQSKKDVRALIEFMFKYITEGYSSMTTENRERIQQAVEVNGLS
ncbi:hypothetical protein FFLO_06527 [Filobasidium floriforme]|uniref:Uncharacterized protein n=1 Tax=Filobasidium floriforme TaxID=5210 RepID=A0A8K0JG23_9TREE|nr:hypothetical protein FFLO_06527 [Filobasidium floriforme]